jgi:hypothetical protein
MKKIKTSTPITKKDSKKMLKINTNLFCYFFVNFLYASLILLLIFVFIVIKLPHLYFTRNRDTLQTETLKG